MNLMDSEYVCSELKTIICVRYRKLCPMIFLIKPSIKKKETIIKIDYHFIACFFIFRLTHIFIYVYYKKYLLST